MFWFSAPSFHFLFFHNTTARRFLVCVCVFVFFRARSLLPGRVGEGHGDQTRHLTQPIHETFKTSCSEPKLTGCGSSPEEIKSEHYQERSWERFWRENWQPLPPWNVTRNVFPSTRATPTTVEHYKERSWDRFWRENDRPLPPWDE